MKLRNRSAMALHRFGTEIAVGLDQIAEVFSIELAGQLHGSDQIAEHHRQMPALWHDFGRGHHGCGSWYLGCGRGQHRACCSRAGDLLQGRGRRLLQRRAALAAEARGRRHHGQAGRALDALTGPALRTELGVVDDLGLAADAFHGNGFRWAAAEAWSTSERLSIPGGRCK